MKLKLRVLSMLMAVFLVVGMLPVGVLAVDENGSVHVIVENTTATASNNGIWVDTTKVWSGVLLDKWVELPPNESPLALIKRVVEADGKSYTDDNKIEEIAGLRNDSTSIAGWMVTLNDWFTNSGIDSYTLSDGDELHIQYSMNGGTDIGSIPNDTTKTLKALEINGGALNTVFRATKHTYELSIGSDKTTADISFLPTATNKNFQVRIYKGDYSVADEGYKRGKKITVKPGDVITIVVGDKSWPSMNNGIFGGAENVPAEIYTFNIISSEITAPDFDSFFTGLSGIATVTNDTVYPWVVDDDGEALVSTNAGQGNTAPAITLTFSKAVLLSFFYKASSEDRWDYLKISKNGSALNSGYFVQPDFSGNMTEFKEYKVQAEAGDVITLAYSKSYDEDTNSDCVWLKDFTCTLPTTLTLHANDGTDETYEQGIFGTGNIKSPFVREKLRFDGWAETPDGEVVYKSGDEITLTENKDLYAVWTNLWYLTFPAMPTGAKLEITDETQIEPGKWLLPDGDYTLKASLFGYKPLETTISISGADLASDLTLELSERFTLSFVVTPDNATVEVRNSNGTVMTAENGVYSLPAGDYSYTVKASGYKQSKGNVTISKNETLTVALIPTKVWDGETKSEPALINGVYQISNGAELAWFADKVNSGETEINAILTADIELGDIETTRKFTPIGDKLNPFAGHFDGARHKILYLNASGSENIGLFGKTASEAVIERLHLENVTVTGTTSIGGLVGDNAGSIYACTVSGSVTQNVYKDSGIGGIAGTNSGFVGYSYSSAEIIREHTRTSYGYFGGVVGDNSGTVDSCYNLGYIYQAYYAGGVAGRNSGTVKNSFNLGALAYSSSNNQAVVGRNTGKVENCYYLDTCGASDSNATSRTADEFKSLATKLGGAFIESDSHPLHKWEDADSLYTITIAVTNENASVVLTKNGKNVTGTSENGVYSYNVTAGEYLYTVSAEGDYAPQSGTITIGYADVSLDITLDINRYDISFTLVPTDAELTVKQGEKLLTAKNGVYSLPNGDYSYEVKAFGYDTATGSFTVDHSAKNIDVTLTKQPGGEITFAITSDKPFADGQPIITVTHSSGKSFSFTNNEPKFLPDGEYSYTVKAPTLGKLEGEFTISGKSQTITGAMSYSSAWDGETTTEPTIIDRVYQISNGYELAWYRDKANSTPYGSFYTSAVLTADIDLGGNDWTPIYKYTDSDKRGFAATFDGNGHTITGLNVSLDGKGAGLFGIVYKGGIVRNLTVEGAVTGYQYTGGITGYLAGGTIENCTNNASVTATSKANSFTGGIAGYLTNYTDKTSHVTGCINNGNINGGESSYVGGITGSAGYGTGIDNCVNNGNVSGNGSVAGIAGNCSLPVTSCANNGDITATGNSVGGIAGFTNKLVSFCYNTGNISGKSASENGVGGIVGRLHSAYGGLIDSCYNYGNVSATDSFYGSIAGSKSSNTADKLCVTNSYYLTSTSDKAIGSEQSPDENPVALSAEEFENPLTVARLGGSFAYKAGSTPLLDFEDSNAQHIIGFVTDPEGAVVTLTKNGVEVTILSNKVYAPQDGDYDYNVSLSKFNPVNGKLTVASKSQLIEIKLERETFAVNFNVTPADAKISVYSGDTFIAEAKGDHLLLPNGDYSYRVEKFGYRTVNGSFTVNDSPVDIPAITLEGLTTYTVTFNTGVESCSITVKSGDIIVGESKGDHLLLPDGAYSFVCKAPGYFDYEGSFTINGGSVNVNFTMSLRTTWDGTTSTPELVDGVYQIASAEELAWLAAQVNSGNNDLDAILLCDIYVNDEFSSNSWTSIGTYENQYTGTFDGNNHTIKGLDSSLFGFGGKGSLVKNLTLTGSYIVTQSSFSNAGAFARTSYGGFENCVNYMDVSITWQRVGGIVGILYEGGYIKNCANYGNISTSHNQSPYSSYNISYLGGIVGYAYGEVSGCANFGKVENTGNSYGGIGGIAGVSDSTITDSYNRGEVYGYSRTGGIVGIQNVSGASTKRCYNVGKITCTNYDATAGMPFCGAVAGSITDSAGSGTTVALVTDCYYLENSFYQKRASTVHNGGIGYGDGTTVSMTADEMKDDLFALTLGEAFNASDDYPVLKWQGGHTPDVPQDQLDVIADMNSLSLGVTEIRTATTLELATTGVNGSTIVWSSDNKAIASTGAVTLPESDATVTLTATISKGNYTVTKTFTIKVYSLATTARSELDSLKKSLSSQIIAVYGTDTNAIDCLKKAINKKLGDYITIKSADDLTYTITNITAAPNFGDNCNVDENGTITYFYRDPAGEGKRFGRYYIDMKLGLNGTTVDYRLNLYIPWNRDLVMNAMTPALNAITFDSIKGENTSADEVTKSLRLPSSPEGYGWTSIEWSTDRDDVLKITQGIPSISVGTAEIITPAVDSMVTLTAKVKFNFTNDDYEPDITLEKMVTFSVKGSGTRDEFMQSILDKYTLESLTDFDSGEAIDPDNVTGDIQLLTPKMLGFDGRDYKLEVKVTGKSNVDYYHLYTVRPLGSDEDVTLTVTLTHIASGESKQKVLGTIRLKALTDAEIESEIALMNDVKAHFFDGIKNLNRRPDHITSDLHAFREAHYEDGKLVFVYNIADDTGNGIKPVDLPKEGYDESYNLFHSSDPTVIAHENLLVTRPDVEKMVTLTACLSSIKLARYAEIYPDDTRFASLVEQMVTFDLTVVAKGESDTDWRDVHDNVLNYLYTNVTPTPGSQYGEWALLSLSRSEFDAPAWYLNYTNALKNASELELNDYTRAVIALTSLGLDATDYIPGMIAREGDRYLAERSGNTALAFALIALDTKPYDSVQEELISLLLDSQLTSGAWNINDKNPDANVDATAMVITALSKYHDRPDVKTAIDNALDWLGSVYSNGFGSSESDAQVIVALTSLGIEPDERFDGLLDSLLSYAEDSGAFRHDNWSTKANELSTEQAAYALTAYWRFVNGKNSLYDMSDAELLVPTANVDTINRLISELNVTDCSRETKQKLDAIKSLYSELTDAEKALVDDIGIKDAQFNMLLDSYKQSAVRRLGTAFEALDSGDYSTSFWNELEKAYRDGLYNISSADCSESVSDALDKAIDSLNAKESTLIYVTFMLIGDDLHGDGNHESYSVWIPETGYKLKPGSTVYDLFTRALSDNNMSSEGASSGYVSAITAPAGFGGFTLGEFDNGDGSGWVYTVNGDYPEVALTDYTLEDGDQVVWSYVDNYKSELPDMDDDDHDKPTVPTEPEKPETIVLPFDDIDGHWSYGNIEKMYSLGLMNGISETKFAPDMTLTRGMFATILWRMAGSEPAGETKFTDLKADWYRTAVAWCYENGIVNGTSETTFSPDSEITREQLAVMLIRFAQFKKIELEPSVSLEDYEDSSEIDSWAVEALGMAVANGIMNGRSKTILDPLGKATRAECAAMVIRFIGLTEK